MRILVGDIGGTKTVLAHAEAGASGATLGRTTRFDSGAYASLLPMVQEFLAGGAEGFDAACFGVAGPLVEQRCEATNLPWVLDARELSAALGGRPVVLLNDFVTVARAVPLLGASELVELCPGERAPRGPIAVLGAGTGLGEAFLVWGGDRYVVVPSEGGHGDFAPQNELQLGLLRWLLARHEHVSYERVVSGLGLRNVYAYLREAGVAPESPAVREALARGEDLGAVVGTHGVARTDPLCEATLDLFVDAYGAEAGNLALRVLARGGVFLAGGIAGKLLPRLRDGRFRAAYGAKGRLSSVVASIPVYAIAQPQLALLGAAAAGFDAAGGKEQG